MAYTVVFFDLETTGLDTEKCDIVQIAAVCGTRTFNAHVVPLGEITKEANRVTGFLVADGVLYRRGTPVATVPLHQALSSFIEFVGSFCGPVYLAAHNARRFDVPVLNRALRESSLLREFQRSVSSYLDTFLLAKWMFTNIHSYSLQYMAQRFLGKTFDAHNALEDAKILQELFGVWKPGRKAVANSLV
ncbi:DNA polymerase III PolC-type-like [Syngnathoides biaculeatus]|uniref:DNA polymerase III PolC-type-like n=1 Tax=Syngnathoides biaculeatus TaxID=300417 RepID=UPI002ADE4881|nr:DNA polymerase III PolC-type-like [Syngnathoides biaculeatus]